MEFPVTFICSGKKMSTLASPVPAPCFRRSFFLKQIPEKADLLICGLGFYELYVNGNRLTKGALAPYISSPDDIIYYDAYQIASFLKPDKNVLAVILGNGMQNAFGGGVWDFDKAPFRDVPKLALSLHLTSGEEELRIESDESFLASDSPILSDDLRIGEVYDARLEQKDWLMPHFDDTGWTPAVKAAKPAGKPRICEAQPIVVTQELPPVSIQPQEKGWLYDFGVNTAGICRLRIKGKNGQKIQMEYGELLTDGRLDLKNIQIREDIPSQRDIYICRGGKGEESYTPRFTYHGFRYVFIKGITKEQAIPELLTCLVMNSDLKERGGFLCSDDTLNKLQEFTRRSTLANFYYFPTDCPHREKNGWTGDASLSSEHTLLNLNPEKSYREWLCNIRAAQADNGALPGIVPTGGWGFQWGNGPAWDSAIIWLPYYTYLYRGDKDIIKENAHAIFRYLHYLHSRFLENGLVEFGLGDWCPPNRGFDQYKAPLIVTDSIISMDIFQKAAYLFGEINQKEEQQYAEAIAYQLWHSIRNHLIDFRTLTVLGDCQTSQALALYFGIFIGSEQAAAFQILLNQIHREEDHMDTGILGARVIFHVLSQFGKSDLAYRMITRPDFPSYGNWVARGATSLWEEFQPEGGNIASQNHHFFGDISSWMIKEISGICLNPLGNGCNQADIRPHFLSALTFAKGWHEAPAGRIESTWERSENKILLTLTIPDQIKGRVYLEKGYMFEDGRQECAAVTGIYPIISKKN